MSHPSAQAEKIDIREHGAPRAGEPQVSDRRLFMQLQAFGGCFDPGALVGALEACPVSSVLYQDLNDPAGIAVLTMSEDTDDFVGPVRRLFASGPFRELQHKPELTMTGRTYATGREPDLENWLFTKPRERALSSELPWVVWYPLRRKPEFALLGREEQGKILMEHARIGMSYGQSGLAHDIRLACYGLDRNDNEFVLGLLSNELHPLSHLVQRMRSTQQTARYIQSLGPFFVGKVFWQSPLPS